jgi:L-rhamnose mutarotase
MLIGLRPEAEREYCEYHAKVWPEVLDTIRQCNIRNYSIFLRDGKLFAYFEYHGSDYEADMKKMAADPATQRWWSIMDPMQVVLPGATPGSRWLELDEVFHTD